MPFTGVAHVGYIPDGFLVGVSKLARLVDCYAMRLQLQERLCQQIADAIVTHVSGTGAAVVMEASHCCLSCRGARRVRASFVTSAMLGKFRKQPELRQEFLAAIAGNR
jgi:GTP cyclohydrolase I